MEWKKPNIGHLALNGGEKEELNKETKSWVASGHLWNSPSFGLNFLAS